MAVDPSYAGHAAGARAQGGSSSVLDVLVVGAGPTGLTAAGDLARAGRSVAVLDRRPDRSRRSRAFATTASTLELLDARGLAEDLLARGVPARELDLGLRGGPLRLPPLASAFAFALVVPQAEVDAALDRSARAHGAAVHRGVEVVDLAQDDGLVVVTTRPTSGEGPPTTWRARYVVGADGARSTVRRLVGVPFPGRTVLSSMVLADVRLTGGPPPERLTVRTTTDGFAFLVAYHREEGAGWYRAITWDRRREVPLEVPLADAEVVDRLRSARPDVGVAEVGWRSRFSSDERQVGAYRVGRVLLAGDAAHVHSPMGGQGMNTGVQDAAGLAWKIDAVLGGAPDAVLDTHGSERHPVGRRVLRRSGLMARGLTTGSPALRALRDAVLPVVLRLPPARDRVVGGFAGTTSRYPRGRGEARLVGTRATAVPLVEGSLTAVLRTTPGFVLVEPRDVAAPGPAVAPLMRVRRTDRGPALLVRPDGYVAWAGTRGQAPDGWRAVLAWWTGTEVDGRRVGPRGRARTPRADTRSPSDDRGSRGLGVGVPARDARAQEARRRAGP
ncbi:FAD-dependent oxidoreductase [Pseudokineococcus sp. 1T1Z-3]|uniref:FAD-dependent oxidoreductase n=1 Tax=Pseudokineococcus sp. 1T1Z-3 TaxID=3132745 RepID=UPI00309D6494